MEEHSLAEEIMNLGRNRHQYSATELKVKFNEFSRKLKQANSENNEAGDCKLIDSLRALSILAEMCGELENAEVYLKRVRILWFSFDVSVYYANFRLSKYHHE